MKNPGRFLVMLFVMAMTLVSAKYTYHGAFVAAKDQWSIPQNFVTRKKLDLSFSKEYKQSKLSPNDIRLLSRRRTIANYTIIRSSQGKTALNSNIQFLDTGIIAKSEPRMHDPVSLVKDPIEGSEPIIKYITSMDRFTDSQAESYIKYIGYTHAGQLFEVYVSPLLYNAFWLNVPGSSHDPMKVKFDDGQWTFEIEGKTLTIDPYFEMDILNGESSSQCDFLSCLGGCFASSPVTSTVCGVLCASCLIPPITFVSCIPCIGCVGPLAADCILACENDVCSHCTCPSSPAQLTGKVIHQSGTAWPGIYVFLVRCSNNTVIASTYTDDQGKFILAFIAEDAIVKFRRPCSNIIHVTDCIPFKPGKDYIFDDDITLPECDEIATLCGRAIHTNDDPYVNLNVYAVDCDFTTLLDWQVTDENGEYTLSFTPQDLIVVYDPSCPDGTVWVTPCINDISSPGDYCFTDDHLIGECDNTCNLTLHIADTYGNPWQEAFAVAQKCDGTILDHDDANSNGVIELSFPSQEAIVCLNLRCGDWLCFVDEEGLICLIWPGGNFESEELRFDTCEPIEQKSWGAIKTIFKD